MAALKDMKIAGDKQFSPAAEIPKIDEKKSNRAANRATPVVTGAKKTDPNQTTMFSPKADKYVEYGNRSKSILSNHSGIVGPLTDAQASYILKNHPKWAANTGEYFPHQRLVIPKKDDRILTADEWLQHSGPSVQEEFTALSKSK